MKPLILNLPKPRNPVALAARRRSAGAHGHQHRGRRQAALRDVQDELKQWQSPPR